MAARYAANQRGRTASQRAGRKVGKTESKRLSAKRVANPKWGTTVTSPKGSRTYEDGSIKPKPSFNASRLSKARKNFKKARRGETQAFKKAGRVGSGKEMAAIDRAMNFRLRAYHELKGSKHDNDIDFTRKVGGVVIPRKYGTFKMPSLVDVGEKGSGRKRALRSLEYKPYKHAEDSPRPKKPIGTPKPAPYRRRKGRGYFQKVNSSSKV